MVVVGKAKAAGKVMAAMMKVNDGKADKFVLSKSRIRKIFKI